MEKMEKTYFAITNSEITEEFRDYLKSQINDLIILSESFV